MGTIKMDTLRHTLNAGDWLAMQNIIESNSAYLNARGQDGFSILELAISQGQTRVLEELLKKKDLVIADALLHATEKGDLDIATLIVKAMKSRNLPTEGPFKESRHFKWYMTPLMLASLKENYQLAGYYISIGHKLKAPHGPECGCSKCSERHTNGENLEYKMRRIDSYSAISSSAYILHQEDPVDFAMELDVYLNRCKKRDVCFREKYDDMIIKLRRVTVSLAVQCDTQESMEAVLNCGKECSYGYYRMNHALQARQKEFLAQPSCQTVLCGAFWAGWNDWHWQKRITRLSRLILHSLLYPLVACVFIFSGGAAPKSCRYPIARIISDLSSYVVFLSMLIFYTQYKEDRDRLGGPRLVVKQWALLWLFLYIFGMWAVFITDLRRLGWKRLFDVWWRRYDCAFLLIWTLTLLSFIDACLHANEHGFHTLHRTHWGSLEPQLIYEIWFTWASVLSSVRLFYYSQLLNNFGSIAISVSQCIPMILRYVLILFIILMSFAIGLNHLYEHYKDNVVTRDGIHIYQPFTITKLFTIARYLYWAFYGYLPPENWNVIVGNTGYGDKVVEKYHDIISNTGELMSGVYHVVNLIILLNLMVSIMCALASSVVEQESLEWKFVRVQIWAEYFHDSRSVPPPFNLLQLVIHGSIYILRKISGTKAELSAWDCKYMFKAQDVSLEKKYKEVMAELKTRLLMETFGISAAKEVNTGGSGTGSMLLKNTQTVRYDTLSSRANL